MVRRLVLHYLGLGRQGQELHRLFGAHLPVRVRLQQAVAAQVWRGQDAVQQGHDERLLRRPGIRILAGAQQLWPRRDLGRPQVGLETWRL